MALYDSLVGFWKMDEVSGDALDFFGSTPLTDTNTVGNTTGLVYPTVRHFILANSEYFTTSSVSAIDMGDIDFWVAAWAKLDSKTTTQQLIAKSIGTGTTDEFGIDYLQTSDRFRFWTRSQDASHTFSIAVANTFGSPSTGVWYLIIGWHNAATNTVNISVNNGSADSVATSGLFPGTGAPLYIGAFRGPSLFWDGDIGPVMLGKNYLPTADDRTFLYNGGAGRTQAAMLAAHTDTSPHTYTANGLWVALAGVTEATVEARGAGGAGGANAQNSYAKGGGGGGAYAKGTIPVTPGFIYTVSVGASNGSLSRIIGDSAEKVEAIGGGNALTGQFVITPGSGGTAAASTGNITKFSGGDGRTGTTGTNAPGGGGGEGASSNADGVTATGQAGASSAGDGGDGGSGGNQSANGVAGTAPGGGGGGSGGTGSAENRTGGNGARGEIVVSWTSLTVPKLENYYRRLRTG